MKQNIPPEMLVLFLTVVLSIAVILFLGYLSSVILDVPILLASLFILLFTTYILYTEDDDVPGPKAKRNRKDRDPKEDRSKEE